MDHARPSYRHVPFHLLAIKVFGITYINRSIILEEKSKAVFFCFGGLSRIGITAVNLHHLMLYDALFPVVPSVSTGRLVSGWHLHSNLH